MIGNGLSGVEIGFVKGYVNVKEIMFLVGTSGHQQWVFLLLFYRTNSFLDRFVTKYRVRIGTWNVYGKMPAESLGKWLISDDGPAQLYVIWLIHFHFPLSLNVLHH